MAGNPLLLVPVGDRLGAEDCLLQAIGCRDIGFECAFDTLRHVSSERRRAQRHLELPRQFPTRPLAESPAIDSLVRSDATMILFRQR